MTYQYKEVNKDTLINELTTKLKLSEEEYAKADLELRVISAQLKSTFPATREAAGKKIVEAEAKLEGLRIGCEQIKEMIKELK